MADSARPQSSRSKQLLYVDPQPDAPFLIGGASAKPPFGPIAKSSALERAREFLPQMRRANQDLSRLVSEQGSAVVNLEVVDDSAPHIEMNLGWISESSDDEGNDSRSSEDSENDDSRQLSSGNSLKTTASSRKPKIQVIDSHNLS
eukprot:TRINITY_DN14815_c0_g1_i1.p1 TRINITY_DN14815_c0_g1~~TRINITY_DN14815_c0_g1_i1.p1  ORF type:complete len:153 (-),score=26.07 TRINITY_DN14815_c0_g1_i1:115-552(-)